MTEELSKIKRKIKTEKLKSTAVNVATSAIEGIGYVFDSSKLKIQEKEIGKLKAENITLRAANKQLYERISRNEYEKTTNKLREELRKIYNLFPGIRDLFNILNGSKKKTSRVSKRFRD